MLTVVADVRDLGAMEAAVSAAVDRFGGIDIVMANAGISTYGSVLKVDPEAFRLLVDVNIVGVFNTVRAALPSVIDRRGYVLVVSSAAAFGASPGLAPYDTAKAGVEHFANALRLEVAHLGVDVGSAHMLWIDTPLVQDAKSDLPSFRKMLDAMPGPLGKTTSVEACGKAFVKGIEAPQTLRLLPRLRRGVALAQAAAVHPSRSRPHLLKSVPELLPQMDAEVEALGRSTERAHEGSGEEVNRLHRALRRS